MENKTMSKVRGYKVFNSDWTCNGFQYEVGKIFEEDVTPCTCDRGFHFCENAADCFSYYNFDSKNKVAEVIALGEVDTDGKKSCTNKIQIVREIPWQELLTIVNIGKDCTGLCNTGDWNTGDWNTGNWNTGNWNKSSFNTGCFNTENSDARCLLNQIPKYVVEWIYSYNMTDEEKVAHPTHETTGGYLKVLDEDECGQLWWGSLSEHEKNIIKAIPNFDAAIFEQCTGIKID